MALTAVHCVLFVILGLVVTRPFLRLFTQDEAVLAQACDYTYVVLCWSFGCLMQIGMEKIYQGLGEMNGDDGAAGQRLASSTSCWTPF